jgi:hypothetical protein
VAFLFLGRELGKKFDSGILTEEGNRFFCVFNVELKSFDGYLAL